MVQIWYMDESDDDQREEHLLDPPQYLEIEDLRRISGVKYWKIDVDNVETEGKLKKIREERSYNYHDIVDISRENLPNYDELLRIFYTEHIHADDEIRLFFQGGGYLDVRDTQDRWIRIKAVKGDLLALPAGIYHRFTLDKNNYAKVMRLFSGDPVWTPIYRPADEHPARKTYLQNANKGFGCCCEENKRHRVIS